MNRSKNLPVHRLTMEWTDDEMVFDTLDDLMVNSWVDFKNFMDAMAEHRTEFEMVFQALLFGGLGQLVVAYNEARAETNTPQQSLGIAIENVMGNPLFQTLVANSAGNMIDKVVEGME